MTEDFDPTTILEVRRKAPRNAEKDTLVGFALRYSDDLLLVQHVSDRYDLDGYFVIRRRDVLSAEPDPRAEFSKALLTLKGITAADLSAPIGSLAEVCAWLRKSDETCLVELTAESDTCYVGYVRSVSAEGFELLHLSTRAERQETEFFSFADVDCIGFGGEYERSLMLYDQAANGPLPH